MTSRFQSIFGGGGGAYGKQLVLELLQTGLYQNLPIISEAVIGSFPLFVTV